jgi:hypothetical protein
MMKFKDLFRKDRHLAQRPNSSFRSLDDQGQPELNLPGHFPKGTPDSEQSEESAFGLKVLVPGEAPLVE